MATISTKNSLTDFDMCLAVAQTAINSTMEFAWKAWQRRSGFKDKVDLFKIKSDGKLVDSKYGLSVTIAPLTVSLNVKDGKLGQVMVTLLMKSGKVVYYDEAKEEKAEFKVEEWSVSFITDLDKKPVDLKLLETIDRAAYGTAQDVIAKSGLPEGVFSIEYLFLKLTQVDLMLSDNKNINIPKEVPSSARNKALSSLNLLLQGEIGEFIMGTVVRRNNKQATPTFALTDFIFDVHPNWSVANAGTLNYLGQFCQRAMPADTNAARLKLADAWVRPEQLDFKEGSVHGIMAIGNRIFLEKYLIPKFKEALKGISWESVLGTAGIARALGYNGPDATREKLTWTFSEKIETGKITDDLVGRTVLQLVQGYKLSIKVQPSASPQQVSISGRIDCSIHNDGTPWEGGPKTHWIYVDGHQDFSGSLTLIGNGIGTKFDLESKLTYEFSNPVVDRKEVGGFSAKQAVSVVVKVLDPASSTVEELFAQAQKKTSEALLSTLKSALARLDMNLKQHVFIPPGGGVFTFSNPCFSNAGDLFFDVIYRAP